MDFNSHLLNSGLVFFKNKDYTQAKKIFSEILNKNSNHFNSCFYCALTDGLLGNYQESIVMYQKCLALMPDNTTVLNNLGYMNKCAGDKQAALDSWHKALTNEPNNFDVLENLGLFYKEFGPLSDAVGAFDKILSVDPLHFNSLVNQGNTLIKMRLFDEALSSFNDAYKLNPDHPSLLNSLSNAYVEVGQLSTALKYSKLSVEKFPKASNAHNGLGLVYRELKQYDEAVTCFQNAALCDPNSIPAQSNLVKALYLSSNFDAAIKTSKKQLGIYLKSHHSDLNTEIFNLPTGKLLHDIDQAKFIYTSGHTLNGINNFIEIGESIKERATVINSISNFKITRSEYIAMLPYLTDTFLYDPHHQIKNCLNPEIDWKEIENNYLSSERQVTSIDNFLTSEALEYFRKFCNFSKCWTTNYDNNYLGAFARQGFISAPHLQLAKELKLAMPNILRNYDLEQLWGFKYESTMNKGIGVHADSAAVNLNFWITPDICNLNKDSGGMIIYTKPAPINWTFQEYNGNENLIYDFLGGDDAEHVRIPYRSNRATLFNSALFHETDSLIFQEGYSSRRVNMTYLFGTQLL